MKKVAKDLGVGMLAVGSIVGVAGLLIGFLYLIDRIIQAYPASEIYIALFFFSFFILLLCWAVGVFIRLG